MHFLKILFLFLCINISYAECVRWQPDPDARPQPDGPGSFGELQDTITLDCLKYIKSIYKNGQEYITIKDELGKLYNLGVGDYMGENSGIIRKIDHEFIYLEQIVNINGEWELKLFKFSKKK